VLSSALPKLLIIIPFVIALVGGFFGGVYYQSRQSPKDLEKVLPLPLNILTNRMIYEWMGSVEGHVVKKDTSTLSLTLEKDGNRITIKAYTPLTRIYDATGEQAKDISFSDIPISSFVRSTVWLPVEGKLPLTKVPGDIVARDIGVHNK
jgi:uncharacterized protein YneF (UPF0154 family)